MAKKIRQRTSLGNIFPFRGTDNNGDATDIFSKDSPSPIKNLTEPNDNDPIPMGEVPNSNSPKFSIQVQEGSVIETDFIDISAPVVIPRSSLMPALGLVAASTLLCAGYLISPFDNSTSVTTTPVTTTPVTTHTIPHDTPQILLPPTKEVGIFEFSEGNLLINTKLGFGISTYAAAISKTDLSDLLSMSSEDQLSLVQRFNADLKRYTSSDLTPVLDLTIDIIGSNSNVKNPDTTYAGLRNPRSNVIHSDTTLIVPITFSHESPDLEDIVYNQGSVELPGLGKVIQEYFELRQIERDIPSVSDDLVINEFVQKIATEYNSNQAKGSQTMFDLTLYSKEDRKDLASRLYRQTSDRKSSDYMTVEEILDLVNFGAETKIKSSDIRDGFSRKDSNQNKLQQRRNSLLNDTLEIGYANLTRKDILDLASKYDISERTIKRDLEELKYLTPESKHVLRC